MTIEKTVFEGGKYTVVQNEGRTTILRYEETWREADGDKFINAVVDEVKRLRAVVEEVHAWIVCGAITTPQDMAGNFEHITKITAPEAEVTTDSQRVDWLLPVITGEESFTANQRTTILGACLMAGLDGRMAIDRAMEMTK